MEIDRPSNGGICIGTIDVRIMFQIVKHEHMGAPAEFIEGSLTVNPGPPLHHDPIDIDPRMRNRILVNHLWKDRLHTVMMPRPTVDEGLQEGADLGTMQAITAALVISFNQERK